MSQPSRPVPQATRPLPSSSTRLPVVVSTSSAAAVQPSIVPSRIVPVQQRAVPTAQQQPQQRPIVPQQRRPSAERKPAVTERTVPGPQSLNVQNAQLPSIGSGCMVVQLAVPRMDIDAKYIVHCHIKAPNERWREFVNKSQQRDIVNERVEDKNIKFTRLELVYGHAQVLTNLMPGTYQFRIQSWPHGLISELKEVKVVVKPNETTIVSAWIHSFHPVGMYI
jgi:hypothetical protein